jgi:hypothetical protein
MISLNRIAPRQWLLIVLGVIVFIVLMAWPDDGWFPDSPAAQQRAKALKAQREAQRKRDEFLTKCEHVWTRPVSQLTAEEVEMIGVCRDLKTSLGRH